ncbi:MAG: GAF domain-containing sensor histidine kinase [Balneolaceae bacterium]|nr:GAF domain-containing sensor histidine kinase [Balneolaceae bacterium]
MVRTLINHLKAIQHLSDVINDLYTVKEIADTVTGVIINMLGYEDCVIYAVNEEEGLLEQISAYGSKSGKKKTIINPISIPIGSHVVGTVAESGEPLIIHNTDNVKDYLIDDQKRHSEISVPIKINNKVIGVIDSEHSRKNFYTESDLVTLSTIASIISLQLDKALKKEKISQNVLELQEVLKLVLSHSKSAILMEDLSKNILVVNQTFCNAVGKNLSPEDFQGLSTLDFADKFGEIFIDVSEFIERVKQLKSENQMVLNEQVHTRDGKYYLRDFIPVKISDKTIGYLWQYNDATDTIKSKQQMQKALEIEKKFNRLNKNLVSLASHELRTPLTSIKSTTDLILSNAHTYDAQQMSQRVKRIKRASDTMGILLDDIMTMGKLENFDTRNYEVSKLSLQDLVSLINEIMIDHFPDRKVDFHTSQAGNLILSTYKNKLYLILKNLLCNAAKYSDKGTPISVIFKNKSNNVDITIKDTGLGIPEHQLDDIFESFTRADNVRNIKGTGLGLVIVKRALNILDGKINIQSEVNKGTTVNIQLPYNQLEN